MLRAVPEVAFWTAACLGVWLLTLSSVSVSEIVTAAAVSVACGVLAARPGGRSGAPGRRGCAGRSGWSRCPSRCSATACACWAWPPECSSGAASRTARLRTVQLPRGEPERRRATRQAAAAVLVSASPGTVVLDVDEDTGELRLHALGAGRPRTWRRWSEMSTGWLVLACVLSVAGLGPGLAVSARGRGVDRVVGLQFAGSTTVLLLVALVAVTGQPSYLIVPLALVLLSFAGTLAFTRLLAG